MGLKTHLGMSTWAVQTYICTCDHKASHKKTHSEGKSRAQGLDLMENKQVKMKGTVSVKSLE